MPACWRNSIKCRKGYLKTDLLFSGSLFSAQRLAGRLAGAGLNSGVGGRKLIGLGWF
ncbi:hypothetical protein EIKCOROL_01798 [Eikenella corrodens ATCC 23834]|uniref:Uncharacterized protein n=1 Tax=Eikenella corrodens ATCC 23834 TaxID=546274 RepID=C0DWP6_EIKCO|nr:hypothetical protein EIKCOROL_01798 [Eikenella corrodens ATCC 23834]